MSQKTLRIASRKSPLALWQANFIRDAILRHHPKLHVELLPMTTSGDKFLKDKLQTLGGKGLFVKELEEALLDRRADIAVHSMKDVPATCPDGLSLAAIYKRDNPFDALICKTPIDSLRNLPLGATIGTTSLRRQSQLLAIRPDFKIKPLRGNINTRLSKMQTDGLDAIVLAVAGLERMNMQDIITETLNADVMLPACGQGALGIECRSEDEQVHRIIAPLHDKLSSTCVQSERLVNAQLGGNCHVPLAVYCSPLPNGQLQIRAKVASLDGVTIIEDSQQAYPEDALIMAEKCAISLLAKGAATLLAL